MSAKLHTFDNHKANKQILVWSPPIIYQTFPLVNCQSLIKQTFEPQQQQLQSVESSLLGTITDGSLW